MTRFTRTNIHTEKETSKRAAKVLEDYTVMKACPDCHGKRYNQDVLASTIDGYNMHDLTAVQLTELNEILQTIDTETRHPIIAGIQKRVQDLIDIGLGYMDLCRETGTLSGGESQRVKMVKQLASSLTNILYIFDEPSTGLHPRDVYRLNDLLRKIRDAGNTVLVVEHDPDVIQIADHIVDVGPHAGRQGGEITFTGSYSELLDSQTLTGQSLSQSLPINQEPRSATEYYESAHSSLHNLKNVQLRIPKGIFTAVTGVAGSGKSTLVNEVFAKKILRSDSNHANTDPCQ